MKVLLIKRRSAWLPVAMSFAGVMLVLGHALIVGVVHEADEGTPAHVWQLLMTGQVPVIIYFALRWLPRLPGQALWVLVLQAAIALASFASVFFLT